MSSRVSSPKEVAVSPEEMTGNFDFPDPDVGLISPEVERRRHFFGFNEVVEKKEKYIITVLKKFAGPVEIILEILALYFFVIAPFLPTSSAPPSAPMPNGTLVNTTGVPSPVPTSTVANRPWINGIIVMLLVLTNVSLGLFQGKRASNALKKLKANLQVTCRVLRDKQWSIIQDRELLPGDVVRLRHGDFVPADMKIIEGSVDVDQSPLTGESLLIAKSDEEGQNEIYGGSILRRGECIAFVTRTGRQTFHGKSMQLLQSSAPKLHVQALIANFTYAEMACVVALLIIAIIVQSSTGRDVIAIIPVIATLLVAGVPVALPVVFSVTLSLASRALTKRHVLLTRLEAASDASEMTVLCTDKTGTLTQNKITVVGVWSAPGFTSHEVTLHAALASKKENEDPIDLAVFKKVEEADEAIKILGNYKLYDFQPFDAKTRRTEAVHRVKDRRDYVQTMKGAVDVVSLFCKLSKDAKKEIDRIVDGYSKDGSRTLAVARCTSAPKGLSLRKAASKDLVFEFVGIIALADPPREDTKAVISSLKHLGIRVIMLTGDSVVIAKRVAEDVGIGSNIVKFTDFFQHAKPQDPHARHGASSESDHHGASDGETTATYDNSVSISMSINSIQRPKRGRFGKKTMTDFDLENQKYMSVDFSQIDGFAEIFPEDKHLIVQLLQNKGFIVGMTGDGANDAPALRQAEVGIAVSNATDVAKSAASAVLTDDGLSGIVVLIKEGRKAHQKIVTWLLNKIAKTFMLVGTVLVMYFITGVFVIDATKVVVLLFLVDFVLVAISSDNVRPSHKPEGWRIIRLIVVGMVVGVCMAAVGVGYLFLARAYYGLTDAGTRTLTFCVLYYFTMFTLLSVRERRFFWNSSPSWQLFLAVGGDAVVIFILGVFGIPPLDWPPIYFGWIFATIGAAMVTGVFVDFVKLFVFQMFRIYDKQIEKKKKPSLPPTQSEALHEVRIDTNPEVKKIAKEKEEAVQKKAEVTDVQKDEKEKNEEKEKSSSSEKEKSEENGKSSSAMEKSEEKEKSSSSAKSSSSSYSVNEKESEPDSS